jgi:hypothetical protein
LFNQGQEALAFLRGQRFPFSRINFFKISEAIRTKEIGPNKRGAVGAKFPAEDGWVATTSEKTEAIIPGSADG